MQGMSILGVHEYEMEVTTAFMMCFRECVTEIKARGAKLPQDLLWAMSTQIQTIAKRYDQKRQVRYSERKILHGKAQLDEEMLEVYAEQDSYEDNLRLELSLCYGKMIECHRADILPTFLGRTAEERRESMMSRVLTYGDPARPEADHQFAIFVCDDIIEWAGPSQNPGISTVLRNAYKHVFEHFVRIAIANIGAEVKKPKPSAKIIQCAVFGLGLCAEHAGQLFATKKEILQNIIAVMNFKHVNPRVQQSLSCVIDNGLAAFGKVLENQIDVLRAAMKPQQCAELCHMWLKRLPLQHDKEESPLVLGMVLRMLSKGSSFPELRGPSNAHLPAVRGGSYGAIVG